MLHAPGGGRALQNFHMCTNLNKENISPLAAQGDANSNAMASQQNASGPTSPAQILGRRGREVDDEEEGSRKGNLTWGPRKKA